MTLPRCTRLWQVEAIRDGRLSGKDLELAERHREHCHDCAEEARKLGDLQRGIAGLPELPRDPLAVRRARQALLAAVNHSLLASPPGRSRRWAALAVLPAAALGYLLLSRHSPAPRESEPPKSAVEVRAKAGARWVVRTSAGLEQVELSEGEATFEVHPHPDRRVLVRLPDGEIEDRGTTFEVAVRDQHTAHIAVSEGRVAVRLASQPEFSLGAGDHWELPVAAPVPSVPTLDLAVPSVSAATPPHAQAPHVASSSQRVAQPRAAVAAPSAAASAPAEADTTRAEDAAYLGVVALLRRGRSIEARAQAKAYLLRFPSGFRRVEMLNVATSAGSDSTAP